MKQEIFEKKIQLWARNWLVGEKIGPKAGKWARTPCAGLSQHILHHTIHAHYLSF